MAKDDLLALLYNKWNIQPVKIIISKSPFSLKNTMFKWNTLSHHTWYNKSYKKYLADAHSDVQLTNNNLPDVLRNSIDFTSTTPLNSNYGELVSEELKDFDGIFPAKDEFSNLFQGILTFSKGFLLEAYIINQSQNIANVMFEAFVKFNHLNKEDWVFQSALHKNTSIFHVHYRMYQMKGAKQMRNKNFSAKCLKFVKEEVLAYLLTIKQQNNNLFKSEFKLQQAYIRFAQETSLLIGLVNSMLDLALTNKYNFNDDFKHWIINLAIIQPHHMEQYKKFQHFIDKTNTSIFLEQKAKLDEDLKRDLLTREEYAIVLKKWKDNLKALYNLFIEKWIRNWEYHIANEIINLWRMQVDDVCNNYEHLIKSNQNFHTLKESDRGLTYLEFSGYSNNIRLLQHKAILYLTSMYLMEHTYYNDQDLYDEVGNYRNTLSSIANLYAFVQDIKTATNQELNWNTLNEMVLRIPGK